VPLLELGEGVFKTREEPLASFLAVNKHAHNVTIIGKGPGVTEIYGKIKTRGWYPNFRHFAHYDDPDKPAGWALMQMDNPGTLYMQDIWSHPPAGTAGIVARVTNSGAINGKMSWGPRNAPSGGARLSVSSLYDVHVYGAGKGMSFTNDTTSAVQNTFSNHLRFFGGHIVTEDTALMISSAEKNFTQCMMIGFHIDVRNPGKGLRIGKDTHLTIYAPGFIEPGWLLKEKGGSYISGPRENITVVGDWPIGGYIKPQ